MILLDPQDQQQVKLDSYVAGPTVRLPDRVTIADRSSSLLPDYETSQALLQQELSRNPLKPTKNSYRFWRATLLALAIYITITIVIGVPLLVVKSRKHPKFSPLPWDLGPSNSSSLAVTQSGILLVDDDAAICDTYDFLDKDQEDSLFLSNISHSLSPSDSFLFRSNISTEDFIPEGLLGSFNVDINPDPSEKFVVIHVSLKASSPQLRERAHVCFCDEGNNRGLSLYVPNDLSSVDVLVFSISLLLPQTSSTLYLDCLKTDLPLFSQHVGYLGDFVSFSLVNLQGSHQDITCDSVQGRNINVKNSLAAISGTYNASEALGLDTVGGPIYADITLAHDPALDHPTVLHVDTGNSDIMADITLSSPKSRSRHSHGPAFVGSIKTFNAPLSVSISHDSATPSLPFDFHVQNNQGETNVTTDAKFSGFFDLQTKLASAVVDKGVDDPFADPSGQTRLRQIHFDQELSAKSRGWVGWGPPPRDRDGRRYGRLEVLSSLRPVRLRLGPKESS